VIKLKKRCGGRDMQHTKGAVKRTKFWTENQKGRDHFGDLGVDG
jgi:hypothetical protein